MKKRFILYFFVIIIICVTALPMLFVHSENISYKKPLFKSPDSIAVSEKYIFINDGFFNQILVYNQQMEYVCRVTYKESGYSTIFVNDSDQLCRFDDKSKKTFVYDIDSNSITRVELRYSETYMLRRHKLDTMFGVDYKLNNSLFKRSMVTISTDGNSTNYYLSTVPQFILQYVIIIGFIAFGVYTIYGFARFMDSVYK